MKRTIWLLIALHLACFLFPKGIAEAETQLTEECLAQFGEDTCDAARLLDNKKIAVVSGGMYYEYDLSGNQKGATDLTHPQLKNARVSGIEILESVSYVIVPYFDYVTEQSYCAYITKAGEVHFSDLMDARVDCGCLLGDKVLIAGSQAEAISNTRGSVSSWFKVLAMDGSILQETTLTAMERDDFSLDASVDQCVGENDGAELIEQIRSGSHMALRMITISPDGSATAMAEMNLSSLQGNLSSLEVVGVLSENDTMIVYGVIPQTAGQAPFMLRVDRESGACAAKMFDSARILQNLACDQHARWLGGTDAEKRR